MSNFNLTISPAQIEYLLKKDTTITQAYDVINNSQETIQLISKVLSFIPQGGDGDLRYQEYQPNDDISFSLTNSDIKLNQPFSIPPKSKQQLVLKIKTSPRAEFQDSYYTFFVQQLGQNQSNFSQATGQIGSHILLTITDQVDPTNQGHITNFQLNPTIKDVFLSQLNFTGEIRNDTNHFIKSTGRVKITKKDKIIREIPLQSNNILANHYRQIHCQGQQDCSFSPPFWPGKYTATLELEPMLNTPSKSITFFIFPISPLAIITLFILLFLLLKKLKNIFSQENSTKTNKKNQTKTEAKNK